MTILHGPRVGSECAAAVPAAPELLARIRGEYREMPGLRLSFAQACRLWQLDTSACVMVLEELIREGFLYKTRNGDYIAALPAPARQVKAQLRSGAGHLPRSA